MSVVWRKCGFIDTKVGDTVTVWAVKDPFSSSTGTVKSVKNPFDFVIAIPGFNDIEVWATSVERIEDGFCDDCRQPGTIRTWRVAV